MKNLKLSKELSASLGLQPEGEEKLLFSAFDVERNRVFFASSESVLYSIPLPLSQEVKLWRKDLLYPGDDSVCLESGDRVTALDYLMEKEAVIVGTANGYLVLHTVDWNSTEVVGRVEGGIKGISSSPDGALLAVIAGLGQCLVMTHDWEVLYEVSLDTQPFHDSIIGNTDVPSGYQFSSIISWRGDGKYFATLTGPCELYSLKKLQMWERDSGNLHATTESTAFIRECLAWMPSGAKVVAAHESNTENGPTIVLYEKNGLERSYFSLDAETGTVVGALKWNCSSDLLASSIRCDGYDAIRIWSFSNYHWYMKQEIRYAAMDQVNFDWDPTKPLHLVCWTVNGNVKFYSFVWDTAVTETSNAFVVDGYRIHVSPLNVSLIPPPMYLFELKFPNVVSEIACFCKNHNSYLAACLSDGTLCIIELPATNLWEQFEEKQFVVEASHFQPLGTMRHLTWLDSHILVGVSYCGFNQTASCSSSSVDIGNSGEEVMRWSSICCLQEVELECSENSMPQSVTCSGWHVKDSKKLSMEGLVVGIAPNPTKKCSIFVQLDEGTVLEYSSGMNSLRYSEHLHLHDLNLKYNFSSTCPWMKSVLVCDNDILQPLIFGLDPKGRLQIGSRTLCDSCSSFSFYSDTTGIMQKVITHLIFTTKQDLLFIVDMDEILHGNPEMRIESYSNGSTLTRKGENKDIVSVWERGATLIGVIHGDEAAIILQALRGNLECIYPRKLVILAVANALAQRRFKDALLLVRRHRIDFNIIVDYYGLQAFLKSAEEFVSQVSNLGHITEFVCAIKKENVAETLYKSFVSIPSQNGKTSINIVDSNNVVQNKVSSVLSAIRKALEDVIAESPARELCILTTLARSEPPALEEALMRIKVMRELELSGHDDTWRNTHPSAEEALKHLLWLTNAESVYDVALGLYDLNLAAIVALNSDKDPKEFLPFLQKLEQMPPNIMQYTIDLRLHRYENALRHIVSAGDEYFGDSMILMKNSPSLFPLGLQLFTNQAKRDQVLEAWGDHLFKEKHFEDAAMTYLCCSSFQKAKKAHRACGDWRGVLTVSGLLQLSKDEMLQLATDLCDELQTLGRPAEAAKVALEYCLDVPGGVEYYVIAREWLEALRICYLHRRGDLKIKVRDAAMECANTLINEYEEGLEKVGKYVTRYLAVRQRHLLLAAKLKSEERPTGDIDEDTLSETSSTFSGMSAYTSSSVKGSTTSILSSTASKSRERRRQRNRGKIRAGSPGEESALVEHLKGMYLTDSAQRELASLLHALIMLGKEEIARHLQRAADKFHLTQVAAVKLAEDASATEKIDENTQTLDHYMKKLREEDLSRCTPSPQTRLLLSG